MTEVKPLDVLLNDRVGDASDEEIDAALGNAPVEYTLTMNQWAVLKQANEMVARDAANEGDLIGYFTRLDAVNELVQAVVEKSTPRVSDNPDEGPQSADDVVVPLLPSLFVGLFSALHVAWHVANRGELQFEPDKEDKAAEVLAEINDTHTRALTIVQPYTDHFNHSAEGKDFE